MPGNTKMKTAARLPNMLITALMSGISMARTMVRKNQVVAITALLAFSHLTALSSLNTKSFSKESMPSLKSDSVSKEIQKGLEPAAEEQYGIGGVCLGCHGNESDHDRRFRGRVVGDDVIVHLGAKGEVAKSRSPRVHSDADGDGRRRRYREVLDGSVLHAGVDRNHRHVTLKIA